jgi:hypothetical protein
MCAGVDIDTSTDAPALYQPVQGRHSDCTPLPLGHEKRGIKVIFVRVMIEPELNGVVAVVIDGDSAVFRLYIINGGHRYSLN